jgi:hypothetical protein
MGEDKMIKKYLCKIIFSELEKQLQKNLKERRTDIYAEEGDFHSASSEGKIAYQCLNLIEEMFKLDK